MIQFLWQLPQNLFGFIVCKITGALPTSFTSEGQTIACYLASRLNNNWAGVSLGKYIVIAKSKYMTQKNVRHEYGHQRQSLRLGWLYLVIIGFPSFAGNIFDRLAHKNWEPVRRLKWYYSRLPWERSADKLGNVRRFEL